MRLVPVRRICINIGVRIEVTDEMVVCAAARSAKYLPFDHHDGVLSVSSSLERPPCQLAEAASIDQPMTMSHQDAELHQSAVHTTPPKFPITNGSLFTSLDGHIPIVHNYRRRRGESTANKVGTANSARNFIHTL